jgi:hypothetical protein
LGTGRISRTDGKAYRRGKTKTNTRGGSKMEQLIREIREIINQNRAHLEALPAKDRAVWVMLSIANNPAFRETVPRSEEFLTEKDATLGYIYTVGILIRKLLKEEGL